MKQRFYKYAGEKIKSYYKAVGKGWEVGAVHGNKTLFVGNFIHEKEASAWYALMGREVNRFSKRFSAHTEPTRFHWKFVSNTLYKHYYDYLNRCFGQHTKNYHREFNKDVKTYARMKRHFNPREVSYNRRAA